MQNCSINFSFKPEETINGKKMQNKKFNNYALTNELKRFLPLT
jgi:hypothetical protein